MAGRYRRVDGVVRVPGAGRPPSDPGAVLPGGDLVTRRRAGDARQTGEVERNTDLFVLAAGLQHPGDVTWTAAAALVEADLRRQVNEGRLSAAVVNLYSRDTSAFAGYEESEGRSTVADTTVNDVAAWLEVPGPASDGTPPALETMYARRSSLRAAYTTLHKLGLHDVNPAMTVYLPKRAGRTVNPLTDQQVQHLKDTSVWRLGETKTGAAYALTLLGANGPECASVRVVDIDFDNNRVWLHDGGARSFARWVPIDDPWCREALLARVQALRSMNPNGADVRHSTVAYEGRRPDTPREGRSAATKNIIQKLMKQARVYQPGVTRVESIREWLALRVYEDTGRVEAVAERLGMSSLDAAAHMVGHDWKSDFAINAPPPGGDA